MDVPLRFGKISYTMTLTCVLSILTTREEDPAAEPHGHITSLSVMRTYRRLGVAEKLMTQSRKCSLYRPLIYEYDRVRLSGHTPPLWKSFSTSQRSEIQLVLVSILPRHQQQQKSLLTFRKGTTPLQQDCFRSHLVSLLGYMSLSKTKTGVNENNRLSCLSL